MADHITQNPGLVQTPQNLLNPTRDAHVLPSFSPTGWIRDPVEKLDYLFCHFFEADAGMSYLNPTKTYNIQDIFGHATNDPLQFTTRLEEVLYQYLLAFFEDANVKVIDNSQKRDEKGIYVEVSAQINVIQNGKVYDIQKVVQYRQGKFSAMLEKNNYGRGVDWLDR